MKVFFKIVRLLTRIQNYFCGRSNLRGFKTYLALGLSAGESLELKKFLLFTSLEFLLNLFLVLLQLKPFDFFKFLSLNDKIGN